MIKDNNSNKNIYNSNYIAETYSENYKLASTPIKKEKNTNNKLISSITIIITVIIVTLARLLSGVKIEKDDINIESNIIEYDFILDYKEKDHLIILLYNDNNSYEVTVNDSHMKGGFVDLTPNTEYTLEIKDNKTIIYTKSLQTKEEIKNE